MPSIYGWLTPSGQFAEVAKYGHLSELDKVPDVAERIPELQTLKADVQASYEACQAIEEKYGHGEWHCYESDLDSARYEAWRLMLSRGFIRVASMRGELHFEGLGPALADKMQKCKDIAEGYGMTATFDRAAAV